MRPTSLAQVSLCTLVVLTGAAGAADWTARRESQGDLVTEARQLLDSIAHDLIAGDRTALAARYDRRGAYLVGNGRKAFHTFDSIRAIYQRPAWQPPRAFEWHDLSYEVVGPEAVVVTGRFEWDEERYSYTALLVREAPGGPLRIRLEDESADPRTLSTPPCPRDSVDP